MAINIYHNDSDDSKVEFSGDLFFRIYNQKNKKLICRFAINTSFMDMQGYKNETTGTRFYRLDKRAIDPDSIQKSKDYSHNFGIEIQYQNVCEQCKPENPLEDMCKK